MAPFDANGLLLEGAVRAQAQVDGLDQSFAALPGVIPKQAGGRRSRRSQRGGALADFNAPYMTGVVPRGVNPQFTNEAQVNPMYSATKGAQ